MKKSAIIVGILFLFISISSAGMLFAQPRIRPDKPVLRPPIKKPLRKSLRPDLIVSNIDLIQDCWIRVTIQNIGTAGVPDAVYAGNVCAIQMYEGNQPHGGMVLSVFDPGGQLKTPGTSVSRVWFQGSPGLNLDPGTHAIRVDVDADNAVAEANESNNSLTQNLTCQGAMPDLIVSDIKVIEGTQVAGCPIEVTVSNIGTGGVPDAAYGANASALNMYYGNNLHSTMALSAFDTGGILKTPGTTVSNTWCPTGTGFPGTVLGYNIVHPIRVWVDANNAVTEVNENNNSTTRSLTCNP
jgi:hypothetical protein